MLLFSNVEEDILSISLKLDKLSVRARSRVGFLVVRVATPMAVDEEEVGPVVAVVDDVPRASMTAPVD